MQVKNLIAGLCVSSLIFVGSAAFAKPAAPSAPPAKSDSATPAKGASPAPMSEKGDTSGKDAKAKQDAKAAKEGPAVGEKAPAFALKDYSGKEVKLEDLLKTNKAVVVQWFNPGCPFVSMHYLNGVSTFNDLHKDFSGKGIAFVGINSGAAGLQGHGDKTNKDAIKDWKIQYPILNDESGTVGRAYSAKTTPQMFIITADGIVAYNGAIDNNQGRDKKDADVKNYVRTALEEIVAGKTVTTSSNKPYGCSVKFAANKK